MGSPTWAEAATQLTNGIKPFADLLADLSTILASIDSAEQALEGDHMPAAVVGNLAGLRNALSVARGRAQQRAIWTAWMREACRVAGLPYTRLQDMHTHLHRYMHDNSYSFNDRNQTIPATASPDGSNVGTGDCAVLAVDHEGYSLQTALSETKRLECVQDQNTGRLKNAEVFELRGEDAAKDDCELAGSGIIERIYAMHAGSGEAGSHLSNSSGDREYNGSGTDKIPGWTIGGTAAKITRDTTAANIYRAVPGSTSNASFAFADDAAATNEITQALSVKRINALGEMTPWMLQCAYRHSAGSITGTLNLKMGSSTQAIDLSGATTSFQVARMDRDKDLYYRNWKEDAPDIEIEVVNLSAGTLYIDDIIFAPLTQIGGLWWWLVGGATAFLMRDFFTHATTGGAAADADMMWSFIDAFFDPRGGRPVIPTAWAAFPTNNAGAETISDP